MSYGREYLEFAELLKESGYSAVSRRLFTEYVQAYSQARGYGVSCNALTFFYGDNIYKLPFDAATALRLSYAGSAAAKFLETAFKLKPAANADGWATAAYGENGADSRRIFAFLKILSRDGKPKVNDADNYDFIGACEALGGVEKPQVTMSNSLKWKSFYEILCGVRDGRIAVNENSFALTER